MTNDLPEEAAPVRQYEPGYRPRLGRRSVVARVALGLHVVRLPLSVMAVFGTAFFLAQALDLSVYLPDWANALLLVAFVAGIYGALRIAVGKITSTRARGLDREPAAFANAAAQVPDDAGQTGYHWRLLQRPLLIGGTIGMVVAAAAIVLAPNWKSPVLRLAAQLAGTPAPIVDSWVRPPSYTGKEPALLTGNNVHYRGHSEGARFDIPAGSVLIVRVNGGLGRPVARLHGRSIKFHKTADKNYRLSLVLDAPYSPKTIDLSVEQAGQSLGTWYLRVKPDEAPRIILVQLPEHTKRQALRLAYEIKDDLGIAAAELWLYAGADETDRVVVPLALQEAGIRATRQVSYLNLTAHPWAGDTVDARLAVKDSAGQFGFSKKFTLELPARHFHRPMARALVSIRKTLLAEPHANRRVAKMLEVMSSRPQRFRGDETVYLALRTAYWRLRNDDGAQSRREVGKLLWDTTLRIEDGQLSLTEQNLRQIQARAFEAFREQWSSRELIPLFIEFETTLKRYMDSLVFASIRQIAMGHRFLRIRDLFERVQTDDLFDHLALIRKQAETGAWQQARSTLREFQAVLEELDMKGVERLFLRTEARTEENLESLRLLLEAQQNLLDQVFQAAQTGNPSTLTSPPFPNETQNQQKLQRKLALIISSLESTGRPVPKEIYQAETNMSGAREALRQRQAKQAVSRQNTVVALLHATLQTLSQDLSERYRNSTGVTIQPNVRFPGALRPEASTFPASPKPTGGGAMGFVPVQQNF